MEFRLTFPIQPLKQPLNYRHKILLAGSCFAENIGTLMAQGRFDVFINPNGIVYNPISIATSLERTLSGQPYREDELFYYNQLWNSWQHHGGAYSDTDIAACLAGINNDFDTTTKYLHTGHWLLVTFGSAFIYRLKSNGQVVANCHKYPAKEFDKELLTVEEITTAWKTLAGRLAAANPALNIIFTVSPVRYVRDGMVENNRSKAILLQAVHTLCETCPQATYFPAYELVMDDLRDYRFFNPDMVHPTHQAIEYVWDKFTQAAFDEETHAIYAQVKQLVQAVMHRPLYPNTDAHNKFRAATLEKLEKLQQQYPFLQLDLLRKVFENGK